MSYTKQPSVAGLFYPSDPKEIIDMIKTFLKEQKSNKSYPNPKALIVPHAGYIYSGSIAASAYNLITDMKDIIKNVVMLGPAHRVPFYGIATTHANFFATPIDKIEVNQKAIEESITLDNVNIFDKAFENEHCLEVQMPFLQLLLKNFTIAPFIVGDATPEMVKELINLFLGKNDTLIIISSDLSHFHSYEKAKKIDSLTSTAIEALSPFDLNYESACGRLAIQGLLLAAQEKNLSVKLLDYRNSGDTAGDKSSVVGYGAYTIY